MRTLSVYTSEEKRCVFHVLFGTDGLFAHEEDR